MKEINGRIQILLLEDNPKDAELLQASLEAARLTCEIVCVETENGFRKALERSLDLIISDYTLPSFDGKNALRLARECRPDVPFIFVSGTLGEEAAVDGLLSGATDYVLKHKFARFIPAVQRALREAQEQKARREAEQALRQSEEKYRRLFEESPDTIFVASADGTLMDINPAGVKLLGYSSKTGLLQANIALDVYWDSGRWKEIRNQLQYQGRVVEDDEVELKRKDGTKLIVLETMTCIPDQDEGAKTFRGTWRDVTKHRELETQFFRAQRLESLGSLAGGIAHDLNNALSPIVMGIQVLREKHRDAETLHYLSVLEKSTKRGLNLLRQILMFARGVERRRVPLHVKYFIDEVDKILEQTFPRSIGIATHLAPDLWMVCADKTQLEQVLMNLCVNARDAMPDGGTLTIKVRNEMHSSSKNSPSTETREEPFVVIEVCDTGQGIPPDDLDKIFDPFFTTKEAGKGTGLGLSTVTAIVKSHGGFIRVDSKAKHGTTFSVYLPALAEGSKEKGAKLETSAFPRGDGELVLVVDDEEAVRDLARTILENYNYRVLVAADGLEGLAVYSRQWPNISLVLTDLDVSQMSGRDLIRELERINPAVRVILASGPVVDAVGPPAPRSVCSVLHKPFSPAELLRVFRNTLQNETGEIERHAG